MIYQHGRVLDEKMIAQEVNLRVGPNNREGSETKRVFLLLAMTYKYQNPCIYNESSQVSSQAWTRNWLFENSLGQQPYAKKSVTIDFKEEFNWKQSSVCASAIIL